MLRNLQLFILIFALVTPRCQCFRPPLVSEELGTSPTLSSILGKEAFFFDPLSIATDVNFARLREAELKHGRVAMLAVVETMLAPFLSRWTPLTPGILPSLKMVTLDKAFKVLLVCFVMETLIWVQQDPQAMPGDYNTGYFGIRDKAANERSLIVELEHGRLAMMALAGQIAAELVSGKTWDQQWLDILHEQFQRIAQFWNTI